MSVAETISGKYEAEFELLSVREVLTHKDMQPRHGGLDQSTVYRYMGIAKHYERQQEQLRRGDVKEAGSFPPILVAKIDGVDFVVDGHHRLEAFSMAGIPIIGAEVINVDLKTAKWLAAAANMEHGVPLKRSDIKEAFRRFVNAGKHIGENGQYLTYRQMRDAMGGIASVKSLNNWMRQEFPEIATEIGRNDYTEDEQEHVRQPWENLEREADRSIGQLGTILKGLRVLDEKLKKETEETGIAPELDPITIAHEKYWQFVVEGAEAIGLGIDDVLAAYEEAITRHYRERFDEDYGDY